MRSRRRKLRAAVALVLLAGFLGWSAPAGAQPGTGGASLQATFATAAREFGVPTSILLAVSYDESRWEMHPGQPSVAGGYGLMHLTDVPPAAAAASGLPPASQHTLALAAEKLGLGPDALKSDPAQNLRGGAALLAADARATVGSTPADPGAWYGAIAKYSGSSRADVARGFADTVMATLREGAARTTTDGQRVTLAPADVVPETRTADSLFPPGAAVLPAECPRPLACGSTLATPANFERADRPADGNDVRYIIIHDTEEDWFRTIWLFQDPKHGASAHYLVRDDGLVIQIVPTEDVAFQAGNWYVNSHSIGVEHEAIAVQGATWYNEQLYRASARLVRYLAAKYGVPLDRAHILGHDNVPGQTPATQGTAHWDPGPFWDWAHYMGLLGAPIAPGSDPRIVTIDPTFATNDPLVDDECLPPKTRCPELPAQPANFVPLHVAPSFDAPLIADATLQRLQVVPGEGTDWISDWGDTAVTGEEFYRVASAGDWDAIWFDGQEAWFDNPGHANTLPGDGVLVTPRPGRDDVCVYGEAYPDPGSAVVPAMAPLSCDFRAGQVYVATDEAAADYNARDGVISGATRYLTIFFNHRLAYVRADDVTTLPAGS